MQCRETNSMCVVCVLMHTGVYITGSSLYMRDVVHSYLPGCTIVDNSSAPFSLRSDNLKRCFDQIGSPPYENMAELFYMIVEEGSLTLCAQCVPHIHSKVYITGPSLYVHSVYHIFIPKCT